MYFLILFVCLKHSSNMLHRDFELAETFYFGSLTEIESETKLTTMKAGLVGLIIVGSRSYTLDHVRSIDASQVHKTAMGQGPSFMDRAPLHLSIKSLT